jgi:hypothetical protein
LYGFRVTPESNDATVLRVQKIAGFRVVAEDFGPKAHLPAIIAGQ